MILKFHVNAMPDTFIPVKDYVGAKTYMDIICKTLDIHVNQADVIAGKNTYHTKMVDVIYQDTSMVQWINVEFGPIMCKFFLMINYNEF